ncbi:MAG: Cna B-type domain-containing protein, partial [Kiritimatiellae bacterium]|nr:Cna B-type domain-containing protein [Kiritimatiellia bacterium]
ADPTRSGYTFKGWTLGGTAYDFNTPVTGSITLKAKWEKDAEIWVGGVGMVSGDYLANGEAITTTSKPSDGYAYYKDGVLTLHNYSYTGAGCAVGTEGDSALILTNKNLKLSLMGTNTLMASGSSKVYGIQVAESSSLTIEQSGAGTLMVKDTYRGISVKGDITLNSGSVTIDNASQDGILTWENLTIQGGKLDVDSRVRGIQLGGAGKKVTIEGGEVNIAADGHGILANLNNCTVEIKDGKTQISGGYHGVNTQYSNLFITGGEVDIKATSMDSEMDTEYTAVKVATFDATGMNVRASTEPDGTLGAYVKSIHDTYDWIRIEPKEVIKYTVTVENGDGSGDYAAGETVTITAPTVSGKFFKEWTSADSVSFADKNAATTTFTMPEKNVTVTPVYNTIISAIDLSGITPPVAGATPVNTFTISTPGVDYGAEIFWSRYDEANNKLEQQYPDATLVNNTPFRAGVYYKMQAEVWAKEGYIFTPDTVIRYDGVELPVKDDADLKKNFRYPVIAEYRDRTAASIGWAVAEEDPDIPTIDVTVVKEWDVPERAGIPGSVRVKLFSDRKLIQEAELTADNNWTHTWPEQPKMNEDGSEIVYTVEEDPVEGYESSVSEPIETDTGIEIAITNTLIEEEPASTINVTVAKSWEAPEDVELPESVTVYLKVNGRRVEDYRTILNKENKWTYTWRGLPEFDSDGEYYVYGVDEVAVEGYETIIGDPGRTTESTILFEITNKLKEDPTQPDPDEDKRYPVVITKVLKGISA